MGPFVGRGLLGRRSEPYLLAARADCGRYKESSMPEILLTRPSVQSLLIEMSVKGIKLGVGTGFICMARDRPALITNRHNLTGRHQQTGQPLHPQGGIPDAIKIWHNRKNVIGGWVSQTESLLGQPWVEHPTLRAIADVVALPLGSLEEVEIYPYDLVSLDIVVRPADSVSVVGFPFGLQAGGSLAVWATGFVASEPQIDFRELPVFLVDCRTRRGQSGSAVIFHTNGGWVNFTDGPKLVTGPTTRLLGVYSGRINEESDLGMVWKASAIREIIDTI
jgi:hypothetical protein